MNDADKKELIEAVQAISGSMSRTEAERDLVKELKNDICKKLELDKKVFNKVVKAYHKGNRDEEKAVFENYESLYAEVVA